MIAVFSSHGGSPCRVDHCNIIMISFSMLLSHQTELDMVHEFTLLYSYCCIIKRTKIISARLQQVFSIYYCVKLRIENSQRIMWLCLRTPFCELRSIPHNVFLEFNNDDELVTCGIVNRAVSVFLCCAIYDFIRKIADVVNFGLVCLPIRRSPCLCLCCVLGFLVNKTNIVKF